MNNNINSQTNKIKEGLRKLKKMHKSISELHEEIETISILVPPLNTEDRLLHRQITKLKASIIGLDGSFGSALAYFYLRYIAQLPLDFKGNTLLVFAAGILLSSVIIHIVSFLVEENVKRAKAPSLNKLSILSAPNLPFLILLVFPLSTASVLGRKLTIINLSIPYSEASGLITPSDFSIALILITGMVVLVALAIRSFALCKRDEIEQKVPSKIEAENKMNCINSMIKNYRNEASEMKNDIEMDISQFVMLLMQSGDELAEKHFIAFNKDERIILREYLPELQEMVVDEDGQLVGKEFLEFWKSI